MNLARVLILASSIVGMLDIAPRLEAQSLPDIVQQAYLKALNAQVGAHLGYSVAVSGDTVVVGAYGEGAAHVFVRSGTSWSQKAYLKASNAEGESLPFVEGDFFGCAVSVSGDTAVVGAFGEWSNASGVDGDQSNNSLDSAGAAYVFDVGLPSNQWASLGDGLTGGFGIPNLVGTGDLLPGSPVSIELSSGKPFAACILVVGVANLSVPFKGGVLVPSPSLLFPMQTSAVGDINFPVIWPPGLPSGFSLVMQYWIVDAAGPVGFAASNAVSGTTP